MISQVKRISNRGLDLAMRVIPLGGLVLLVSVVAAQQAVSPHRRMVKLGVFLALMAMMFRFDMVYSVFLFTLLFPFPSGISLGSTNYLLMTLIPLIWAIRATSSGLQFLRKTKLDVPIIVFTFAYVVSFFNVTENYHLLMGSKVLWRQLTCFAYFYMIVNFVDDEVKLMRMLRVISIMVGFVMFTAIVELFFPGSTLISGWINLAELQGKGKLKFRIEGIRVGGALGSHSMLSDLATHVIWVIIYLFYRARNPIEKIVWAGVSVMTFVSMLASANRGAMVGFVAGVVTVFFLFRRRIPTMRLAMIILALVGGLAVAEVTLDKYTYAVSVTDRFLHSEFEGIVPENRTMTWKPALVKSLDHIFIGHGPFYDTGIGLKFQYWPHNAYIFYLYTLGMFGLGAFLWIVFRVWRQAFVHNHPAVRNENLGDVMKLLLTWFVVMLVEQLRTDHQRDDIYPYIIWLNFGLIVACYNIIRDRISGDASPEGVPESTTRPKWLGNKG